MRTIQIIILDEESKKVYKTKKTVNTKLLTDDYAIEVTRFYLEDMLDEIIDKLEEEIDDCGCHCHSETEKDRKNGIQCKCIKNCIHCHPENFPQR